jgi:hypothetical protein
MRSIPELLQIIDNMPDAFVIAHGPDGLAMQYKYGGNTLKVVAGVGGGWDHVSVSLRKRTPNYQEMKRIKRMFFLRDEWAIEYHPPADEYVSIHSNVLHLWRPHDVEIPVPPKEMI